MNTFDILSEMANCFQDKIDQEFLLKIQLNIKDTGSTYFIISKNGLVGFDDSISEEVDGVLTTTEKVLKSIYDGEITAFTAAGKADVADDAPLDWEFKAGYSPENIKNLYFFVMHFFNTAKLEKIKLEERYSRKVHGGQAIPLYYHSGFRSSWFLVKKGDQINKAGDVNPFPQAVIIISGSGFAKIGEISTKIAANESFYIPPNSDHVFWTESEEPLVLIWLAWGEGA